MVSKFERKEIVYELEQKMLPIEDRDCPICKGTKTCIIFMSPLAGSKEEICPACGGTGRNKHVNLTY